MIPDVIMRVVARYGRDLQPIGTVRSLGGYGGLSGSRIWRYSSALGEILIRSWPEATRGRRRIETIHGWLRNVVDLPFVPQPFPALDGRTVHEFEGILWEATPWLPGSPDPVRPPRMERVRAAFKALGMFHARLSKGAVAAASPGLRLRGEELRRLLSGGFDAIEAELNAQPDDPCGPPAQEWLGLARRVAPEALKMIDASGRLASPLQPCLRDARPEHFLFEGDRLTGLIDFGAMDVESTAADLARLNGEWLPLPEGEALRDEGIKAYSEVAPLHFNHLTIAKAFEAAADVLIAERWIRWRFRERRRFDDPNATVDGIGRGLARLRKLSLRLR